MKTAGFEIMLVFAAVAAQIESYARARLRRSLEALPHAPRARWRESLATSA